ncbi:hypothetical protein A605_11430 [Corynebacterium halotolerans YIM 70093 = DSM 44683]|uniref:Uncharacterized protein n=1 Tax=Corynebacterium halotolerans YIM 70093 = DSM 44683 TaxID=1121362 RepID=M1MZY8_9CORY|nr:hypothetical protein A605_11430 [Corynebacterium halotolerans YIM 70093 = DSM 44683]
MAMPRVFRETPAKFRAGFSPGWIGSIRVRSRAKFEITSSKGDPVSTRLVEIRSPFDDLIST